MQQRAGLMIKSVVAKSTITYPFATDVLVARSNLNERDYPDDAQVRQRTDELRNRLAAGSMARLPISGR